MSGGSIENTGAATDRHERRRDGCRASQDGCGERGAARSFAARVGTPEQGDEDPIKNTKVATDDAADDVRTLADGTVIKGGGGVAAAKASKARKAAEAAQPAAENAAFKNMIANTGVDGQ